MLIISNFHDFYDSIKCFGIDKTVVYARKEEKVDFLKGPPMYMSGYLDKKDFMAVRLIGFCGKLYPILQTTNAIIYDKEEALKKVKDSWYRKDVDKCFTEDTKNKELLKIFAEKNTPVFIYGDCLDGEYKAGHQQELIINPKLNNVGFQSVKDPVTAFQDIYGYISGVLGTSAPKTVKITDKEMAKKRGHDDKYSFRKPPGKKGNPKWR
jgi:hypothetical protein